MGSEQSGPSVSPDGPYQTIPSVSFPSVVTGQPGTFPGNERFGDFAHPPYGQQYRAAPIPYTDPRAYQYPPHGPAQPAPAPMYPSYPSYPYPWSAYPWYSYQGYYVPYGYGYQQTGYQGYPPYPPAYPVPVYPSVGYPPRPHQSGYQLGMAITALIGSILAIFGGIFCGLGLLGLALLPIRSTVISPSERFASAIFYSVLMLAGIVGEFLGRFTVRLRSLQGHHGPLNFCLSGLSCFSTSGSS